MNLAGTTKEYDRSAALAYARRWALSRNPAFFDYSEIGGDCTNFASQVLYAGCGVMNFTQTYGWYYLNPNQKSPSWTGVPFLYQFLTENREKGPFGEQRELKDLEVGDLIQLGFRKQGQFEHSLIITKFGTPPIRPEKVYFAAHTQDLLDQKLTYYNFVDVRFIHILGYRI
ncbi:putative amidase-like protein [Hydrogenispora ethanolica]|jgi:hypothetical protein|uniref:Putative amidase-like protein n=1 Tax=Hydrogenispora ethanolica TaxID=1082276 RepID=A0A4R1REA9_HYDET|nr:amidase domain-containing protein [Hydrogenispora ethanolica]TCL64196.1 putative amidase-like protein [Hydrogenispora ethanolica]